MIEFNPSSHYQALKKEAEKIIFDYVINSLIRRTRGVIGLPCTELTWKRVEARINRDLLAHYSNKEVQIQLDFKKDILDMPVLVLHILKSNTVYSIGVNLEDYRIIVKPNYLAL